MLLELGNLLFDQSKVDLRVDLNFEVRVFLVAIKIDFVDDAVQR
jgi:hypothetical protein